MLIFFLIHICSVVIVLFFCYKKDGYQHALLAACLIMLFMPVSGMLICWQLFTQHHEPGAVPDADDAGNSEHGLPSYSLIDPPDVSAEVNVAPHEETLLIADFRKRREMILNLLKQDISSHIGHINLALKNEDTETAHYAASGILHIKRKLDSRLSILSSLHKNNPSDMAIAYSYADLLKQYLSTIHLEAADKLFFIYENIHVLERIYRSKSQVSLSVLIRLIELSIEVEHFNRAVELCDVLWEKHPDSEEKYLTLLKSYFIMKDKQNFERAFQEFRESQLYFSSETMHVIRLWLGSVHDLRVNYR